MFDSYSFQYSIRFPSVRPVKLDFVHRLLYICCTFVSGFTVRVPPYLVSFHVLIVLTCILTRRHQQPHCGSSYCDVIFIKYCFEIDCYIVLFVLLHWSRFNFKLQTLDLMSGRGRKHLVLRTGYLANCLVSISVVGLGLFDSYLSFPYYFDIGRDNGRT